MKRKKESRLLKLSETFLHVMPTTTSDNEMSSPGAASRARELLAAKEAESLLNIKQKIATPPTKSLASQPRRKAGQINVRTETMEESSSRVKDILATLREKRESLSAVVHCRNHTPSSSNPTDTAPSDGDQGKTDEQPAHGKPPLASPFERDTISTKMSESLKERRGRLTRLMSNDHQKLRVSSRSPHTVDTSTTEDSSTAASDTWVDESISSANVSAEIFPVPAPPTLQELEEVFENDESSIEPGSGDDSSTSSEGPDTYRRCTPLKDTSDKLIPINTSDSQASDDGQSSDQCNQMETNTDIHLLDSGQSMQIETDENPSSSNRQSDDQPDSTETIKEVRSALHLQEEAFQETTQQSNDVNPTTEKKVSFEKTVSFDETPLVFDDKITFPSVVHCTSFESVMSKDRSLSEYAPDDLSSSLMGSPASLMQSMRNRRTTSWDASDIDETLARKSRYSSLLDDPDKRLAMMRKLEQTYSELVNLHKEIEYNRKRSNGEDEEESDYSYENFDDESSYEFTNDTNTSGWLSREENNSRLDSLIQYATSEDDDSFGGSCASEERSAVGPAHPTCNLGTLLEIDEVDESDDQNSLLQTSNFDSSGNDKEGVPESKRIKDEIISHVSSVGTEKHTEKPFVQEPKVDKAKAKHIQSDSDKSVVPKQEPVQFASQAVEAGKHFVNEPKTVREDDQLPLETETTGAVSAGVSMYADSVKAVTSKKKPKRSVTRIPKVIETRSNLISEPNIKTFREEAEPMAEEEATGTVMSGNQESASEESNIKVVDSPVKDVHKLGGRLNRPETPPRERTWEVPVERVSIQGQDESRDADVQNLVEEENGIKAGIVQREIYRWEKGQWQEIMDEQDQKGDQRIDRTTGDVSSQIDERDDLPTAPQASTDSPSSEQGTKKKRRRCLFVPRKISNKRCSASGGLFDLAKKTGIRQESTIYVKTIHVPQPPELTALNAEFKCGTQGSLYDLAMKSGCVVEKPPMLKRLKMPPLGGGKKRWLLKARGGHYHISVWTTISNAVWTARVGYSVQETPTIANGTTKKPEVAVPFNKDCGARGLMHIAERSN